MLSQQDILDRNVRLLTKAEREERSRGKLVPLFTVNGPAIPIPGGSIVVGRGFFEDDTIVSISNEDGDLRITGNVLDLYDAFVGITDGIGEVADHFYVTTK